MPIQQSKLYCPLLLILLSFGAMAQTATVTGIVVDSVSRQPIAFAGVTVKETKRGGLTDIDGHFTLQNVPDKSTLVISYTGYILRRVLLSKNTGPLNIAILHKNDPLAEVVVKSDLNPAHRIILLMQQNRNRNDPLHISSYTCNTYTIAALGSGEHLWNMGRQLKPEKQETNTKPRKKISSKDSADAKTMEAVRQTLRDNYLFVAESYTEKKYHYLRQVKETVLASKISGIKNPLFAFTTARFEFFSFYADYFPLARKTYTSPVIDGSINLYKFALHEVIAHEKDTTYVISYEPRKGKNFNGLKGILYINSDGYAIENVTASPADDKAMIFSFRLEQKNERVNGQWFPHQLTTYIAQRDLIKDSVLLYMDTRTYLSNIKLNMPFSPSEFSDIVVETPPGAGKKTEEEWQHFRTDSLHPKEKATYRAYDSMPPKMLRMFNNFNNLTEALLLQAIPCGKADLPFKYFVSGVNRYEKFRLGAGMQTNLLFSKWFSIGGYAGYGIGDKAWKYGGNLVFTFNRQTHTELHLSFSQDLQEPGTIPFFADNATLYSNTALRSLYTSRLDSVRQWKVLFTTKPWPNFQVSGWLSTEQRSPAGFAYGFDIANNNQYINQYNNTEAGVGFRYTWRETYARIGRAIVMNTPPRTQVLLQLSKGLKGAFDGQLDYTKLALQVNKRFNSKLFGRTSFQAELGKVWGNVPYAYLFGTRGIGQQQSGQSRGGGRGLFVGNSFQTVGIYEFSASSMASLYLQQNFGSLLFRPANSSFRPELVLVQNISYGSLVNPQMHSGVILQAPEKGLYETGLLVDNIFRVNLRFFYLGFGVGVFRRYGYYALPEKQKNMAFKFGFSFSF